MRRKSSWEDLYAKVFREVNSTSVMSPWWKFVRSRWPLLNNPYGWWQPEIRDQLTSWGKGSLSHYLRRFYTSKVVVSDSFHQQYEWGWSGNWKMLVGVPILCRELSKIYKSPLWEWTCPSWDFLSIGRIPGYPAGVGYLKSHQNRSYLEDNPS